MNNGLLRFPQKITSPIYTTYDPECPPLNPSPLNDEFDVNYPSTVNSAPPGWTSVGTLQPTSVVRLGALLLSCNGTVSNNTTGIERGILPSGPFTLVTRITSLASGRFNVAGLYVRSSASGRFVSLGQYLRNNGAVYDLSSVWERYNNFGSRNSNGGDLIIPSATNYWRIVYDGTDLYGGFSPDGKYWAQIYQEPITTWFSGGQLPDRFGLKITPFEATAGIAAFEFIRYSPVPFADLGRIINVG